MLFLKGVVGVIGVGFIMLVVILLVVLIVLVVGMVLIFGVDCFMLECCLIINFIGNVVVIVVVSCWEGVLDCEKFDVVMVGCL